MVGALSSQIVYPLPQLIFPVQSAQPLSQESENQLSRFEGLAQQASRITFKLDAVLLEDGTMLGPDTTHFLEAYSAGFAGEQEIVRYIVDSAAGGVPRNEVTQRGMRDSLIRVVYLHCGEKCADQAVPRSPGAEAEMVPWPNPRFAPVSSGATFPSANSCTR